MASTAFLLVTAFDRVGVGAAKEASATVPTGWAAAVGLAAAGFFAAFFVAAGRVGVMEGKDSLACVAVGTGDGWCARMNFLTSG